MPASFPCSFVRASAADADATAADSTMRVTLPPWLRPLNGYDPLPSSLYPILPHPVPHVHSQSMSRSSSYTDSNNDTFMVDAYHYEGNSEDTNDAPLERTNPTFANSQLRHGFEGREPFAPEFQDYEEDNFEFEWESEEEVIEFVQSARVRSVKEKKAAVKAAEAVNKHTTTSRKKLVKTVKNKKASAGRTANVPARYTRSSTRSQPDASTQIVDSPGMEIAQPTEKKTFTRKTWLPKEKAILEDALVAWWYAEGADKHNHPTKMVLPDKKKSNSDWDWILARCKDLDESFDRGRDGLITMVGKIDPLPQVDDSLTASRRRK